MIGNVAFSQNVVPTSKLSSNFQESGRRQVQYPVQVIEGFDVDAVVMNYDLRPASMCKLHRSNEEKTLVNNLLKRIGELPRWSFGWLETIDGVIFPGRYLKGIYSSDIGWRFEEYLY